MDNTRKIFREIKTDAMLTESADLRFYLTGFRSSFGIVYTDAQESVFFTDPRYAEGAKAALKNTFIAVEIAKDLSTVLDYVKSKKVRRLAVPFERVTLPQAEEFKARRFKLMDSMPVFTQAMAVKSDDELALIRKACGIAEKALDEVVSELKEGITENDAAAMLEYYMRRHGAEDRSFETIAAFGKNSSVPHHASGATKLVKGMPVLFDFGCKCSGYCSDITRTFLFGKGENQAEFIKMYGHVYDAHMRAAENIVSGMTGREADALARDHLKEEGIDKFFTHSLGHGIGINIHEYPTLSPNGTAILRDGMVFSIEPGVYFEGKFGIRVEDSVMLRGGKVESFMKSDKKLTVL